MCKRIISLLLAAVMLLSATACGKKEEELVPKGDTVVATVYDAEITKQQLYVAMAAYVDQYDMTMSEIAEEPELREKLVGDFLNDAIMDYALAKNASRYGYEFTEAEQQAFDEQFQTFLDSLDEVNLSDLLKDGKTKEEFETRRQELRQAYYQVMGYSSEEAYKEYQRCVYISGKVKDAIGATVTVDAAAVKAYYENLLNAGKTSMPVTYTFSLANPSIQLYCEDGYRYVKCLLLEFPAASVLANAEYYSNNETTKLQSAIDRDVSYMQETIDEIRAKLASGVDFDDLIAEYGQDTGMTVEPYKSRGYLAVTGDANMVPSYREACEKLTDTEMVEECTTYKGYWFIQASEIVESGPMPFEEIHSAMTNELVAMKKNLQYSETTTALLEELQKSGDVAFDIDKFYQD